MLASFDMSLINEFDVLESALLLILVFSAAFRIRGFVQPQRAPTSKRKRASSAFRCSFIPDRRVIVGSACGGGGGVVVSSSRREVLCKYLFC